MTYLKAFPIKCCHDKVARSKKCQDGAQRLCQCQGSRGANDAFWDIKGEYEVEYFAF